jgi:hypothetical protein
MLSIGECKKNLDSFDLKEVEIEKLRDVLYGLVDNVVDHYITSCDNMGPTCKDL